MPLTPRAEIKMSGDIRDFQQIDNLYRAIKREGIKTLKEWTLEVNVSYVEKEEVTT